MKTKNKKQIGEIGERIAIGELAKHNIDVMLPLSDNLPFDLIVYHNNKFFKCQVKTSNQITKEGSTIFSITTNNWYSKKIHKYTKDEVDVWILCDGKDIFLIRFDENTSTGTINLRDDLPKNNQIKKVRFKKDYIISEKRIEEVFT